MKGYLGLVSEYAKVHKKKNRLTIICIAISVMLVTAIFGMADMSLKAQKEEAIRRYGNWHTIISNIPLETADAISNRKDVSVSGFLGMASSTTYQGKELIIQSSSEELAKQMNLSVTEGHYPVSEINSSALSVNYISHPQSGGQRYPLNTVRCAVLNMSPVLAYRSIVLFAPRRYRGSVGLRENVGAGKEKDRYVLNCPQKMTD